MKRLKRSYRVLSSGRRGRPPSGRARQVEAVRRRCPSSSGRCCHEDATRPPSSPICFAVHVWPRQSTPNRAQHRSAVAEQAAPSPSSFVALKMPLPASPRLHLLPPELVHLTTEPESRGSRRSSSPQRSSIAAGVGGEPAVANHHRSSLPPFSPFPQFPCKLLMLTLGLGWTAMA